MAWRAASASMPDARQHPPTLALSNPPVFAPQQDPYCKVTLGGQQHRTKTHKNGGKNPGGPGLGLGVGRVSFGPQWCAVASARVVMHPYYHPPRVFSQAGGNTAGLQIWAFSVVLACMWMLQSSRLPYHLPHALHASVFTVWNETFRFNMINENTLDIDVFDEVGLPACTRQLQLRLQGGAAHARCRGWGGGACVTRTANKDVYVRSQTFDVWPTHRT